MILFKNGLIVLDYNPAHDILCVELPDMQEFTLPEVRRSFQIIVENLHNYDVKYLLIDSSNALVEIEDEEYQSVIAQFGKDLLQTRLKMLARVGGPRKAQEERAARVSKEVIENYNLPFQFMIFKSRAEAYDWLLSRN